MKIVVDNMTLTNRIKTAYPTPRKESKLKGILQTKNGERRKIRPMKYVSLIENIKINK